MVNINIRVIIFFAVEDGESLYSQQKKKKKDQNQNPHDSTVEVANRFEGLDLVDRVPEELWTEVCSILQEAVIKTF